MISSLNRGGSEGQAVQLVRLLREHTNFDVTLTCLNGEGPLGDELGADAPTTLVYPLTSFHDRNTARQFRRFVSELRRRGVNIVHTHDVYSNIFAIPAARLAGVPVRVASRRDTGGVGTRARRAAEAHMYRYAQKVVVNADAVGSQLAGQGVPREKIVTIHNAVDVKKFAPRLTRDEALTALKLPSGRPLAVLVANMGHAVKDHPTFLRAARRIHEAVPECAFVIAGEGPLAEPMQTLARSLGLSDHVFFIGACKSIGELLALADVCALSSRAEGLSNAILEYMAAGRPVVATDVGGAREAVLHEETGYLVASGDDRAMADQIISLLRDPERARAMGECGRLRAESKFSCRAQLERTITLYESLLDTYQGRSRASGRSN
jgi:L-malate glycosyltransferase